MCRFKCFLNSDRLICSLVSIHHMCRFKRSNILLIYPLSRFQYIICVGSSVAHNLQLILRNAFQYIICVGSSYNAGLFHTGAFVSIHHMCRFKYHIGDKKISLSPVSIHHMCRFKQELQEVEVIRVGFQYIICVGSSDIRSCDDECICKFQYIICVGSRRREDKYSI